MIAISTPDLHDANRNQVRVAEPVFANFGGQKAFYGEISTVQCHEDNGLVKSQAATAGRGRVMVIDGGGSQRRALVGDMIGATAIENGWAGLVIWGMVRDVDELAALPLGVKALGAIPVPGEKRGVGDLDVSVHFAGVEFKPGEWLYADNNGILISTSCLSLD
jgi:regulator of ribonuclease activity A